MDIPEVQEGDRIIFHPGEGHPAVQGTVTRVRDAEKGIVDVEYPHHQIASVSVGARKAQYGVGAYQWCDIKAEIAQLKIDNAVLAAVDIEQPEPRIQTIPLKSPRRRK